MKINWNFPWGGGGGQNKKPSMGGVWIFPGTVQSKYVLYLLYSRKSMITKILGDTDNC